MKLKTDINLLFNNIYIYKYLWKKKLCNKTNRKLIESYYKSNILKLHKDFFYNFLL